MPVLSVDEYVARLVDAAPEFSDAQRDIILAAFRGLPISAPTMLGVRDS